MRFSPSQRNLWGHGSEEGKELLGEARCMAVRERTGEPSFSHNLARPVTYNRRAEVPAVQEERWPRGFINVVVWEPEYRPPGWWAFQHLRACGIWDRALRLHFHLFLLHTRPSSEPPLILLRNMAKNGDIMESSSGPTSAGPVVCVEEVAKTARAIVAADVVMAVVITGQLLVLALSALVHICRAGRDSGSQPMCDDEDNSQHL